MAWASTFSTGGFSFPGPGNAALNRKCYQGGGDIKRNMKERGVTTVFHTDMVMRNDEKWQNVLD
jgi:hypothetical protein